MLGAPLHGCQGAHSGKRFVERAQRLESGQLRDDGRAQRRSEEETLCLCHPMLIHVFLNTDPKHGEKGRCGTVGMQMHRLRDIPRCLMSNCPADLGRAS